MDPEGKAESSKCFIAGAYVFSGVATGRTTSFKYPCLTAALARYVSQIDSSHTFTAVAIFRDLQASPHADVYNEKGSWNFITPISTFSVRDLWVARSGGDHVLSVKGKQVAGAILPVSEGTQRFMPQSLRATMP